MEIIARHEANGALKSKDADVAPCDISVFAIQIADSDLRRPLRQVDLLN